MNKITVNINGKDYQAEPGKTILNIVNDNKIDEIPTLCHSERLVPYASCFVCAVEVEGFNSLKPSCATPISANMIIRTNTEKVMASRKTALELILSNHYADCIAPCSMECPAGVDVQGYIALASMGKYEEAIELIKETNPLPLVCGRVCTRPCEIACRRNDIDEGLAIDHLKRYCADIDMLSARRKIKKAKEKVNKRIALIGSGPASLSASYYLALNGFDCEIFEKLSAPGGMLRWGIPAYRLPREILDREISFITELGVRIHLNREWGRDFSLKTLKEDFDAVFIGIGCQKSSSMRIKGEEHPSIIDGIIFLREFERNIYDMSKKTIMVIGGGNTAIDCARTALRLGSKKVILLYRRTRKEMPANDIEIEEAIKEGVEMHFLSAPVSAETGKDNCFKGLNCIKMKLGEPDSSGRRRPVPIDGSEELIPCDIVISAIGQQTDTGFLSSVKEMDDDPLEEELKYTRWSTIEADEGSKATNLPGIFAGGDIVSGPWIAISAIADGRLAANGISKYLTGKSIFSDDKQFYSQRKMLCSAKYIPEVEDTTKRASMPELSMKDRAGNFNEVELGLRSEDVPLETGRCLSCGCMAVFDCDLKKYAGQYGVDIIQFKDKAGFKDQPLKNIHPFINYELNKCILCGKCVRVCDEIRKVCAISFTKRGFDAEIQPVLDKPLLQSNCISCGECIDICPVGALTEVLPSDRPGPFVFEKQDSICFLCPEMCNIKYLTKGGRPLSIEAVNNESPFNNLCVQGRFGLTRLHDGHIADFRKEQERQIMDFSEKILKEIGKSKIGIYISPFTTNEEALILSEIGDILEVENRCVLSSYMPDAVYDHVLPLSDVYESDLVFVTNPNRETGNINIDFILNKLLSLNKTVIGIYGTCKENDIRELNIHKAFLSSDVNIEALLYYIVKSGLKEGILEQHELYKLIDCPQIEQLEYYKGDAIKKEAARLITEINNNKNISFILNSVSYRVSVLACLMQLLFKEKNFKLHLCLNGINLRGIHGHGFDESLDRDIELGIFYGEDPYLDTRAISFAGKLKKIFIIDEFRPDHDISAFIQLMPFYFNKGSFTLVDGERVNFSGISHDGTNMGRTEVLNLILKTLKQNIDSFEKHVKKDEKIIGTREVYSTNSLLYHINEFKNKNKLR